jgi:hypothetical protein
MAVAFDDDNRDTEPSATHLLFRCRRCSGLTTDGPHADIEVALRRAMEDSPTIVHECPPALGTGGGAWGVAELVGTAERPRTAA